MEIKRVILIVLLSFLSFCIQSQTLISIGTIPEEFSEDKPIKTSELLEKLNWESIISFCDTTQGFYAYTRSDSLKTIYEYVKQGRVEYFEIESFNGFVMEYFSENPINPRAENNYYFDKNVWELYVSEYLIDLPDSLKLSIEEPAELLKAYYRLLGVDTRDEYGWICEYSTVGRAPGKRKAVIDILRLNRIDILKQLMDYPNLQIQLYAIDALIYNDYNLKKKIKELPDRKDLLSIDKKKTLEKQLLTESDWEKIFKIRDSDQVVRTCGNAGSYKVYETKTSELLSEKAISEITKNYELLLSLGY